MTHKSVPQLAVGDRLMHYGMTLEVESIRHFRTADGFTQDCTQAKCRILAGSDSIPRVYTDDGEGTHFTIQGNDYYHLTTIDEASE